MTREQAIDLLDNLIGMVEDNQENDYDEALKMAIKTLEQIDKIEQIIAIDNSVIQEDVLKYKMICEVLK